MKQPRSNKKILSIAISIIMLFALGSCEYNDNEIFHPDTNTNVNPPNIQMVSLDLDSNKDTLELLYNRVYFNFRSSNQKIKLITFYIDEDSIGTVSGGHGTFDLQHEFLYSGYHKLKLNIFVSSGTGSIADSLGAEGFLFSSKEWVIKVGNNSHYNMTTTVSDGFLKLRWDKPYENVSEFIIYRGYTEIGRTSGYEFIVKGHVGEEATYSVWFVSPYNGGLFQFAWVSVPNEINFKFKADKYNNYYISWGKLKYYSAVESVTVRSNNRTDYSPTVVDNITDGNSTCAPISQLYFSQVRNFQISLTPKYSNPSYDPSNYNWYTTFGTPFTQCVIGYPFPLFQKFMHVSSSEVLYHTDQYEFWGSCGNDTLYRYSLTEDKIVDRYRYNPVNYQWSGDHYWEPTTSPDGKYYFAVGGLSNTTVIGSTNDLKDFKVSDLSSRFDYQDYNMRMPISNVGTGIICAFDKKYLYDFINNSPLGYISTSSSPSDYNVSPDGKYIFLNFRHTINLYKYDNAAIVSAGTLGSSAYNSFDYFQFVANSTDKAATWSKNSKLFKIISIPDLTVINSFSVPEEEIFDVDYQSNQILLFSPNLLVVRSLTDGAILYQIPVSFTYSGSNKCYLSGNSVFHQNGARYFLN